MSTLPIKAIELKPGDIFHSSTGELNILQEIGSGGFATVYKAKYRKEEVALKIIKMWNIMPHDRKEYSFRLEQEFKISQKFDSPHIIKMQEYDVINGNPFLIMELCPNGSLREHIDQGRLKGADAIGIAILQGLRDLHQEGIIHRDIKPENILFGKNNEVKLVDFGISGAIRNRVTKPNIFGAVKEVFATVAYCPPEQTDPQRAFKSLAPALDIYAFGITMYELLTKGQLPFGSFDHFQNDLAKFNRIKKNNEWNKDELLAATGSSLWVQIIERCIQAKPSDRYQSANEILRLLQHQPSDPLELEEIKGPNYASWILEIMQGDEIGRKYYLDIIGLNFQSKKLKLGWFDLDDPLANQVGVTELYTNYISSHHATLIFDEEKNRWAIRDGQQLEDGSWKTSKNGVMINGVPLASETRLIQNKDILTFGFTTMKMTAI